MNFAIITDSTCDLPKEVLESMKVERVPLYVSFEGKTHKDWEEITPEVIVKGVQSGSNLPTTSQPSPQDFEAVYREAIEGGAEHILVLTISSELSGTYQSASIAADSVDVPVTVFDSRAASVGLGNMVELAARMRDEGKSAEDTVKQLERVRETSLPFFTVATLEFLQKGGRIGRASALLGSLLNIKPILSLEDGKIIPSGKARGNKKAVAEMIANVRRHLEKYPGKPYITFLHVTDREAGEKLRQAVEQAGIEYDGGELYEVGAVIASHVGPGTYGMYLYVQSPDEA